MARRRVGLFGGSFDPPHVAHLAVAEATREQAHLDRVLWIPAATSPFKPDSATPSPEHRLEMVRLAVAGNPAFAVSDVEVERGGISYTVDTVRELAARDEEADLSLILGGDALQGFERWREPERILERATLVIYRRPGDGVDPRDLPAWLARMVRFVQAPRIELSASEIRQLLAAGRSARYLVPDGVLDYIAANGLYREQ